MRSITDYLKASARSRRGRIRLGIIGLASVFVVWFIATVAITIHAWGSVSKFSNPNLRTLATAVSEQALADAKGDVRRVRYVLFPATLPGTALGWVPWLGRELQAPEQILKRVEADIEATRLLLGGIREAASDLRKAEAAIGTGGMSASSDSLRLAAASLDEPAREALSMINAQEEVDYWFFISDRLQKRIDKVEAILRPATSATVAGSTTLRHAAESFEITSQFEKGTDVAVSSPAAPGAIEQLAGSMRLTFGSMGETVTELKSVTNALGRDAEAIQKVDELLELAGQISLSGGRSAELLQGFFECEGSLLSGECGLDQLLRSMQGPDGTLTLTIEALDYVSGTLAPELERAGAPGVDSLRELTERMQPIAAEANDTVTVTSAFTGAEGQSEVLILGVSPDELRPAGGFVSSAWTAQFEGGALAKLTYFDVVEFDERVKPEQVEAPPESLVREMNAGGLYMRDVTWFPHVPDVGRKAIGIAEAAGYGSHEHVMVMTLWFVARLTDGLGGVVVNGQLLDGDGILKVIEDGTDASGRAFLAELMPALLDRLSGSTVKEDPAALISVVQAVMRDKDASFYSSDPGVQAAIERLAWGGALPAGTTDRVAIFDSNIGWNKSDRHVSREFDYSVNLNPNGVSSASLSLAYSMPGLSDYLCTAQDTVLTQVPYEELAARCNWNFARVYVAFGAREESHSALPAREDAMAVATGTLQAGEDTFRSDFDENGTYFSGVTRIEPGKVSRFEVEYELPRYVIEDLPDGKFSYSLNLVAQPGARGRQGEVTIRLPDSATGVETNAGQVSGNTITVQLDLKSDTTITVRFGLE